MVFIIDIAQITEVPAIVDAAVELPLKENHHRYTDKGANGVDFNGGKAMLSQTKGILDCYEELVQSVPLQQLPADTLKDLWDGAQAMLDKKAVYGILNRYRPTDKGR